MAGGRTHWTPRGFGAWLHVALKASCCGGVGLRVGVAGRVRVSWFEERQRVRVARGHDAEHGPGLAPSRALVPRSTTYWPGRAFKHCWLCCWCARPVCRRFSCSGHLLPSTRSPRHSHTPSQPQHRPDQDESLACRPRPPLREPLMSSSSSRHQKLQEEERESRVP